MEVDTLVYDKKNCELCNQPFGLSKLRNGCKRCKLIICSDCTRTTSIIIGYQGDRPTSQHKICLVCENEERYQKEFIIQQKASWNTMSMIGMQWIQQTDIIDYVTSQNHDYHYYLSLANNLKEINLPIKQIEKEATRGKFDKDYFNYPMLEFLHYIQSNTSKENARINISNVLKAFFMKNNNLITEYNHGLAHFTIFLLCLLDEMNAFYMLNYVVEKILPQGFFNKDPHTHLYGYQIENYFIYKLTYLAWGLSTQEDIQALLLFFEEIELGIIQCLFVDCVNFENLFFIWNRIIENNSYYEFKKFLLALLDHSKNTIFDKNIIMTIPNYQIRLCHHVHRVMVENHMTCVPDEVVENKMNSSFVQSCSTIWISAQNDYYMSIEHFSAFSSADIKTIHTNIEKYLKNNKKGKFKAEITTKITFYRQEFISFIENIIPATPGKELTYDIIEKFFYFIDNYKEKKVSLTHFIMTISMINNIGDFKSKLEFWTKLFETNNKDYLEPKDFKKLLIAICEALQILKRLTTNPLMIKDINIFKQIIEKSTKNMEKINIQNVNFEQNLLIFFSDYFEKLRAIQGLEIIPIMPANVNLDESEYSDYSASIFPEMNYQKNPTIIQAEGDIKSEYAEDYNNSVPNSPSKTKPEKEIQRDNTKEINNAPIIASTISLKDSKTVNENPTQKDDFCKLCQIF